jgi:hypothetical protein
LRELEGLLVLENDGRQTAELADSQELAEKGSIVSEGI